MTAFSWKSGASASGRRTSRPKPGSARYVTLRTLLAWKTAFSWRSGIRRSGRRMQGRTGSSRCQRQNQGGDGAYRKLLQRLYQPEMVAGAFMPWSLCQGTHIYRRCLPSAHKGRPTSLFFYDKQASIPVDIILPGNHGLTRHDSTRAILFLLIS